MAPGRPFDPKRRKSGVHFEPPKPNFGSGEIDPEEKVLEKGIEIISEQFIVLHHKDICSSDYANTFPCLPKTVVEGEKGKKPVLEDLQKAVVAVKVAHQTGNDQLDKLCKKALLEKITKWEEFEKTLGEPNRNCFAAILDFDGKAKGNPQPQWYCAEYLSCPVEHLQKIANDGKAPMPLVLVSNLVYQVAGAIDVLHNKLGLAHGRLSGKNVRLRYPGKTSERFPDAVLTSFMTVDPAAKTYDLRVTKEKRTKDTKSVHNIFADLFECAWDERWTKQTNGRERAFFNMLSDDAISLQTLKHKCDTTYDWKKEELDDTTRALLTKACSSQSIVDEAMLKKALSDSESMEVQKAVQNLSL